MLDVNKGLITVVDYYGPRIARQQNGIWQDLDVDALPATFIDCSFAIDTSSNDIFVVCLDDDHSCDCGAAYVKRFDETSGSWEEVGSKISYGDALRPSIAASLGDIYVAYQDFEIDAELYVKWFDGSEWTSVGSTFVSDGGAQDSDISIDDDGNIFVAFQDNGKDGKVTVKRFDSQKWVTLGERGFSKRNAWGIDLHIGKNTIPYIALDEDYVWMFSDTKWNKIGSKVTDNEPIGFSLAGINGTLYAAFLDGGFKSSTGPGGKPMVVKYVERQAE